MSNPQDTLAARVGGEATTVHRGQRGSEVGLPGWAISPALCQAAEREASRTRARSVPCQLSPWPLARAGFSPPSQVIVPLWFGGLKASNH